MLLESVLVKRDSIRGVMLDLGAELDAGALQTLLFFERQRFRCVQLLTAGFENAYSA